jgi:threonylcarbamoyladenosine tRNA methylthiotransferase MtaB
MANVLIENFGCRAARADGEAIGNRLRALTASQPLAADVVVVNTCSVTAEADRAARSFIRRAHRQNPAARIFVTGCYAQRAPQELAALPGVAAVVGNSHKALAPEIVFNLARVTQQPASDFVHLRALLSTRAGNTTSVWSGEATPVSVGSAAPVGSQCEAPVWVDDRFAHSFLEDANLAPGEQTRPNLKIQEGCGNRCTFCVIPLTRGPSRSLSAAIILDRVSEFVSAGGNELVLSGINLGRWGFDLARDQVAAASLAALVRMILEQTALPRLRLSSIEPMDWNDELIGLMREFGGNRLARHAHLPAQSGSDAVLRRMHRRYRPWHYAEKVEALLRAAGSELTLGADVMVGFPGETDREFEETVAFLRSLPFGYLHLFPFSPRPATPGWQLHVNAPVAPEIVAERMAALRALAAELSRRHRTQFVRRKLPAITLHTPAAPAALGRTSAITDNFLPVEIEGSLPANRMAEVLITGLHTEGGLTAVCAA